MLVIEVNISYDENTNKQIDHQSRVIHISSWEEYVDAYLFEWSTYYEGSINGYNFKEGSVITDLVYDDFHLSCSVDTGRFKTTKLAYKLNETLTLEYKNGDDSIEDCKTRN